MKKFIALLFLTAYATFSYACSTFLLSKDGRHVFGRNYDWITGNGMVMVNPKGLKKSSFTPNGKQITWVSSWGSITFNQYGKEFPNGGMNEKGLVVELMWLDGTAYPAQDDRAVVNELQWIQYQLDNCATVEEVIATDKIIRINRDNAVPLHFLVADANGRAATIEFIEGKMVVHREKNLPYPVLTNTAYAEALGRIEKSGGKSFSDNSVERFATACRLVQRFQQTNTNEEPVDYAFNVLDKVAQGDYTKWRIVYDITNRQVHFVTNDQLNRKSLSFAGFDFSCSAQLLAFDLNSAASGDVSSRFSPLSFERNKALIEQSAAESRSHIQIPPAAIAEAANYYRSVKCGE